MESATLIELLKNRIAYDESIYTDESTYYSFLERLLEDSKYIALSLRYPYQDYAEMEVPKKYKNWLLRCCVELKELIGSVNVKSYSENGLSWTRDTAYLSEELLSEIEPIVGYIKVDDTDDI